MCRRADTGTGKWDLATPHLARLRVGDPAGDSPYLPLQLQLRLASMWKPVTCGMWSKWKYERRQDLDWGPESLRSYGRTMMSIFTVPVQRLPVSVRFSLQCTTTLQCSTSKTTSSPTTILTTGTPCTVPRAHPLSIRQSRTPTLIAHLPYLQGYRYAVKLKHILGSKLDARGMGKLP